MSECMMPPVRLCCGERHWAVPCLDGLVMCQHCYDRFPVEQLAIEDGKRVDVCQPCWSK